MGLYTTLMTVASDPIRDLLSLPLTASEPRLGPRERRKPPCEGGLSHGGFGVWSVRSDVEEGAQFVHAQFVSLGEGNVVILLKLSVSQRVPVFQQ